ITDILNIKDSIFDDRIVKFETHVQGATAILANNCVMFIFDEINIKFDTEEGHFNFCLPLGRKNSMFQEASVFDSCNLNNVKVYLNSDFYPYDDLNLNFENFKKRYTILFNMYTRFRKSVNVRTEFDCKENVLVNTIAYFLIIHDRIVQSVNQRCTQNHPKYILQHAIKYTIHRNQL
ncbi:hypothetical protein ALC53_05817, partial [Atta colombica]